MPDILIVTFDARGSVPRVGIGKELLRRGHPVRVLGHEAQRKTVDAAGSDFRAYRNSPRWTRRRT